VRVLLLVAGLHPLGLAAVCRLPLLAELFHDLSLHLGVLELRELVDSDGEGFLFRAALKLRVDCQGVVEGRQIRVFFALGRSEEGRIKDLGKDVALKE
jgi:hypothetical protein